MRATKEIEMKTLVMFEMFGEGETFFFELEGDYSRLNGVLLNSYTDDDAVAELHQELFEIVFSDSGEVLVEKLDKPTKDWDVFVTWGLIPC